MADVVLSSHTFSSAIRNPDHAVISSTQVKLDGSNGRVVYVRLLAPTDFPEDIPEVNMLKVRAITNRTTIGRKRGFLLENSQHADVPVGVELYGAYAGSLVLYQAFMMTRH